MSIESFLMAGDKKREEGRKPEGKEKRRKGGRGEGTEKARLVDY